MSIFEEVFKKNIKNYLWKPEEDSYLKVLIKKYFIFIKINKLVIKINKRSSGKGKSIDWKFVTTKFNEKFSLATKRTTIHIKERWESSLKRNFLKFSLIITLINDLM